MRLAIPTITAGIVAGLLLAPSARANVVVYTDQTAFLAAIDAPGVDTYDDLTPGVNVSSPTNRAAGPYSYSASTTSGIDLAPAGSPADVWLSISNSADAIIFTNFSVGVRGVGGFFFGSDSLGAFLPGQSILVKATDPDGMSEQALNNTTTGTFLGFVSDKPFSSIMVNAVQPGQGISYPTVNNLTLGVAAIPEPSPFLLGGLCAALGLGVNAFKRMRKPA